MFVFVQGVLSMNVMSPPELCVTDPDLNREPTV